VFLLGVIGFPSAQGGGGQYIILIEELDLFIVTTAHERVDKTMQMTGKRCYQLSLNNIQS